MLDSINCRNNIVYQSSKEKKSSKPDDSYIKIPKKALLTTALAGLAVTGIYLVKRKSITPQKVNILDLKGEELEAHISSRFNAKPHQVNYERFKKMYLKYLDGLRTSNIFM